MARPSTRWFGLVSTSGCCTIQPAYRYAKAPSGVPAEERWVDFRHLREVMDFLVTRLGELE